MKGTGSEPALGQTNNKKHQKFSALSFVTFWNLQVMLNCEISILPTCKWTVSLSVGKQVMLPETDLGSEVPLAEGKKKKKKKWLGGEGGGRQNKRKSSS